MASPEYHSDTSERAFIKHYCWASERNKTGEGLQKFPELVHSLETSVRMPPVIGKYSSRGHKNILLPVTNHERFLWKKVAYTENSGQRVFSYFLAGSSKAVCGCALRYDLVTGENKSALKAFFQILLLLYASLNFWNLQLKSDLWRDCAYCPQCSYIHPVLWN